MTLKEQLMDDLKQAMRSGDTMRKNVIRMVRAAIKNAEITAQQELDDAQVITLIAKDIKRSQESIEYFKQGNRQDLIAEEQAKIEILSAYMPQQLSDKEITATVRQIIDELGVSGPAGIGPVMKASMAKLKGSADGRRVSQIARQLLSES